MCIYRLYIIYLVCFNESIIFASGFQMQYPMLGVCSVCKAVSYAWNVQLSKQYLMLWAVIKVGDCQVRILISGSITEVH